MCNSLQRMRTNFADWKAQKEPVSWGILFFILLSLALISSLLLLLSKYQKFWIVHHFLPCKILVAVDCNYQGWKKGFSSWQQKSKIKISCKNLTKISCIWHSKNQKYDLHITIKKISCEIATNFLPAIFIKNFLAAPLPGIFQPWCALSSVRRKSF